MTPQTQNSLFAEESKAERIANEAQRYLRGKKNYILDWDRSALCAAIKDEDADLLKKLISDGVDPNEPVGPQQMITPLMLCLYKDYNEGFEILTASPLVDYDQTNNAGETLLMIAIGQNNFEAVKFLADKCNLVAVNQAGNTVFNLAKSEEIENYLVSIIRAQQTFSST
jgi:ankyrin repeat protein